MNTYKPLTEQLTFMYIIYNTYVKNKIDYYMHTDLRINGLTKLKEIRNYRTDFFCL